MAAPTVKAEPWLTIPEVAALLRVSRATVYRYIAAGLLGTNASGLGPKRPKLRVPESAVAKFQASTDLKVPSRGRAA